MSVTEALTPHEPSLLVTHVCEFTGQTVEMGQIKGLKGPELQNRDSDTHASVSVPV